MATKAASKRLGKEAQAMERDPPPYCYGRPREDNVLEWHFILRGPPDTPYHGGEFWGQLLFPSDYPFKPPGIKMSTPSGRFKPDSKICTSMSDFHPGSWNPSWSVANILVGLLSFMCSEEMTTGSVSASSADRQAFAKQSHAWNIKQKKFVQYFPEYSTPEGKDLPNMGQGPAPSAEGSNSNSTTTPSTADRDAAKASSNESIVNEKLVTAPTASPPVATTTAKGKSRAAASSQSVANLKTAAGAAAAGPGPRAAEAGDRVGGYLDLGRRKIAVAIALLAYLFLSKLMSGPGSPGAAGGSPVKA